MFEFSAFGFVEPARSWQLSQGFSYFFTGDRPANIADRVFSFALDDPRFNCRGSFWALQPNQHNTAIALGLHLHDIALADAGLLSGFGGDDHLTSAVNRRVQAKS